MTGIYDKNGDEIYPDPVGSSKTLAYSLLYVYPFEVLGGSVASSISQSYGELCFGVSSSREKCSRGMGDIYSDLFFWSRNLTPESDPFGVTIGAGLGAVIPVGKYNVDEGKKGVPQRGGNIWDIVPNAAVTLSTKGVLGGDVTDISARLYYNHYLKNDATDYASGDLVHLSFAVSELYGKWRLGVAFDTFYQIEDDGSPDPRVAADISGSDGKRRYGFSSGPLVQKTFMLANRPWSVKAKVMLGQKAENNITINSTVLVLSTKI
ncbi:transporter [Halomonas eurihalina]|nr:transporter [Halomonas eurihalina]MDR5859254.1 transporter [Halomonas eurihalina]